MIWVLLQSESLWQRNDAITLFIYLCVSVYQEFFEETAHRAHLAKRSPGYANYRVKRSVIHYNIRATLCESFCDVITRVR